MFFTSLDEFDLIDDPVEKNENLFVKKYRFKKIILSISVCLITIICFALMGSKVKANSGMSTEISPVYKGDYNMIEKISLVTNELWTNGERIIFQYALSNNVINQYFPSNYNGFPDLSELTPIEIATLHNDEQFTTYDIDVWNVYDYNEIILDFNFLDNKQQNATIGSINSDSSDSNFDFIKFYTVYIHYYDNDGLLRSYFYNEPIVFQSTALDTYPTSLDVCYNFLDNILDVNIGAENYSSIAFASNCRVGFGSEDTKIGYVLRVREHINSNPYVEYIQAKLNYGSFTLYDDFLQPLFDLVFTQELFWGLSIGGIIGIAIAIPCTIWILKIFFGG